MPYFGSKPAATILSGANIADDSITSAKVVDGVIVAADLAANSVDSSELIDGSIDTSHIGALQVTTAKIAADAIDGTKLADDAVDSEHYTDGSIDNVHLADDAVDSDEIASGAIDNAHMAANSVDSDQYVDGSIDNAHLADDAVDSDELAAGSVDIAHLSATGTAGSGNFLRGDNSWQSAGLTGWSEDGGNNDLLPGSASAGIYLGVLSATAANLLDDYEEGTFTAVFKFGGASGTDNGDCGGTSTYTKTGRTVRFNIAVTTDSAVSGSGQVTFTGLPFTAAVANPCSMLVNDRIDATDNVVAMVSGANIYIYLMPSSTSDMLGGMTEAQYGSGAGKAVYVAGSYTV
jgi:hypothetical protein